MIRLAAQGLAFGSPVRLVSVTQPSLSPGYVSATSKTPAATWHGRQAKLARGLEHWFATVWHLWRLKSADADLASRDRLRESYAAWYRLAKGEWDPLQKSQRRLLRGAPLVGVNTPLAAGTATTFTQAVVSAETRYDTLFDWIFLAMTEMQSGRNREGTAFLLLTESVLDNLAPTSSASSFDGRNELSKLPWNDRVELGIYTREARKLLKK